MGAKVEKIHQARSVELVSKLGCWGRDMTGQPHTLGHIDLDLIAQALADAEARGAQVRPVEAGEGREVSREHIRDLAAERDKLRTDLQRTNSEFARWVESHQSLVDYLLELGTAFEMPEGYSFESLVRDLTAERKALLELENCIRGLHSMDRSIGTNRALAELDALRKPSATGICKALVDNAFCGKPSVGRELCAQHTVEDDREWLKASAASEGEEANVQEARPVHDTQTQTKAHHHSEANPRGPGERREGGAGAGQGDAPELQVAEPNQIATSATVESKPAERCTCSWPAPPKGNHHAVTCPLFVEPASKPAECTCTGDSFERLMAGGGHGDACPRRNEPAPKAAFAVGQMVLVGRYEQPGELRCIDGDRMPNCYRVKWSDHSGWYEHLKPADPAPPAESPADLLTRSELIAALRSRGCPRGIAAELVTRADLDAVLSYLADELSGAGRP